MIRFASVHVLRSNVTSNWTRLTKGFPFSHFHDSRLQIARAVQWNYALLSVFTTSFIHLVIFFSFPSDSLMLISFSIFSIIGVLLLRFTAFSSVVLYSYVLRFLLIFINLMQDFMHSNTRKCMFMFEYNYWNTSFFLLFFSVNLFDFHLCNLFLFVYTSFFTFPSNLIFHLRFLILHSYIITLHCL